MGNFMGLVMGTLAEHGFDTSKMDRKDAIKKFNELKDEGKISSSENKSTKNKIFEQSGVSINDAGEYEIDYKQYDKVVAQRDEYFKNSFDDLEESLGETGYFKLRNSIDFYTKGFDAEINGLLRGKEITDENTKNIVERSIDRLNDAMDNFNIPEEITVFRNIDIIALKDIGIDEKNINDLVGKTYTEKGFSSSSLDRSIAESFYKMRKKETNREQVIFEINIPKGKSKGLPLWNRSNFKEEQEFLIRSGAKFKIMSAEKDENGRIVIKGDMQ